MRKKKEVKQSYIVDGLYEAADMEGSAKDTEV